MKKYNYFFITFPFIFFIFGYFFSYFLMRSTMYQTPNLIGLKVTQALALATNNHATIKLLHQQECQGIEPETIIAQKPNPTRFIRPNQAILVTIAKQAPVAKTPDLKLQKFESCKKKCDELGFKIKNYPIVYPLPQETCIGQIPQINKPMLQKKMIVYTAQEKSNVYLMPNFINKNLQDVINLVENQTPKIGYTIFSEYEKIEPVHTNNFIVVDQKPKPYSLIKMNTNLQIQLQVA